MERDYIDIIVKQDGENNMFRSKMGVGEVTRILTAGMENAQYLCFPPEAYLPNEFKDGHTMITDILVPYEMVCNAAYYLN